MNDESERDFQDFLRSEVPAAVLRKLDPRPVAERMGPHRRLSYVRSIYSHLPAIETALDRLNADRLHMMWRSTSLYHFHWGYAKTSARYAAR